MPIPTPRTASAQQGSWVAGNTLHICGTITGSGGATAITAAGNGSSGNPITIKFETGAQLDAPYWAEMPSHLALEPYPASAIVISPLMEE